MCKECCNVGQGISVQYLQDCWFATMWVASTHEIPLSAELQGVHGQRIFLFLPSITTSQKIFYHLDFTVNFNKHPFAYVGQVHSLSLTCKRCLDQKPVLLLIHSKAVTGYLLRLHLLRQDLESQPLQSFCWDNSANENFKKNNLLWYSIKHKYSESK